MNCPDCYFPILYTVTLEAKPNGDRVLGSHCTHCGRAAVLVETEIQATKFSPAELLSRRNVNRG